MAASSALWSVFAAGAPAGVTAALDFAASSFPPPHDVRRGTNKAGRDIRMRLRILRLLYTGCQILRRLVPPRYGVPRARAIRVDGWTGGRVDGWTGGRVDGWTGGRVDRVSSRPPVHLSTRSEAPAVTRGEVAEIVPRRALGSGVRARR